MIKTETAKKFTLEKTVDFNKKSIVSNTILSKKAGTITTFAFDKGQFLSEHTAPFDACVYLISGEAEIKISGKKYMLKKGETIIMPAGKPHALTAIKKFKMALIMIKSST